MNAYIYQAALLCEDCAREVRASLVVKCLNDGQHDSETYPQGPYPDGGGEADCPQHCDHCGEFLDNPLTDEGARNLRHMLLRRWTRYRDDYPWLDVPLTARAIFRELAPDYSPRHDPWGYAMNAFFNVAAEMELRGLEVPAQWRYHSGAGGPHVDDDAAEIFTRVSDDDLQRVGAFLHRLTGRIRRAGLDY